MRARDWFWLQGRIEALFSVPKMLTFAPNGQGVWVPQTRIHYRLDPP